MAINFTNPVHRKSPSADYSLKEKALEYIVRAIIELEENEPRTYTIDIKDKSISICKSLYSSVFSIIVSHDTMEIYYLGNKLVLNRAKTAEEYFQMMCVDEMYCDEEFEKGIKQLIDLHIKHILKNSAIGGYIEGAYDNKTDS